ncbi:MAG: DEAD/DEAH box helicase [Alphaproteobacteria bacterium]|nr:DEAD/DEAH box helicase [Alphaproteobacteria bacterium]
MNPANPVIVQGDGKVLLETKHPLFDRARDFLARFAELEASPDLLHTYKIDALSLWNAASAGMTLTEIVDGLRALSKFDIPQDVLRRIEDTVGRYGLVRLERHPDDPRQFLRVEFETRYIEKTVLKTQAGSELVQADGKRHHMLAVGHRGIFKQRLLLENWPVADNAGFVEGAPLQLSLRQTMRSGKTFGLRHYQIEAVDRWFLGGAPQGGHGVVVLPCGAGKTVVALEAMARTKTHTLVVCNNQSAVTQWIREILDKTTLTEAQVGEYTGQSKEIKPVTVATYQVLTYRRAKNADYEHLHLFRDHDWGLLVYDEVHLLPAPVFGATAELQGTRRLGLTATLVREDGREGDVFSLVGPKRYDLPWQLLEDQGFVAEAKCFEIRVPLSAKDRVRYENASEMEKFRLASENPRKVDIVQDLVDRHAEDNILVIGTYLGQLETISRKLGAPLITGKTPQGERDRLFGQFRRGELTRLVVSKVANFAIDLPDANVAIQISGSFGSRQEEAQRLGRILRPKERDACFYTVVTADTKEQQFAVKRQLFLTEQGYRYHIEDRAAK